MRISLRPIGDVDEGVVEELKERLSGVFGCPVDVVPAVADLGGAYDLKRKQYQAAPLIDVLKASVVVKGDRVLGIVDIDLYEPRLNFVFGEADIKSGVAIISLHRLRQEYYELPPNEALFLDRATKEAVHELGHTFGLGHCPNTSCVMHFSNSLADTDWKQATFCSQCRPKLIE